MQFSKNKDIVKLKKTQYFAIFGGGSKMRQVSIWEEEVVIPTYEIGEAERAPMFLEKRVYQGSSGKIYPYPAVEKISDEKTDKAYKAVWLENEYLKVMVLPELGGRIQRAYDKTNGYDFVYYNHVIKPALVGLAGPWISGGIEFNWPQHHRPTTYLPVDYTMKEQEDGSCTLFIHDVDQMYGTQMMAGFTLRPGKAYIEITGQLYNRTSMPQTFLWWANPAVPANDYTQSIFPPDVHAVMDHGKRDVSRFPIATGVYYKYDYSEGVDISRYKNIKVPTSYMAERSKYDFVGGYDHRLRAGILHVASHHISPGKKQWTWGCGDFGKAWDRNLTDEDGPYIELMTGVYTDNQPDFTWLKPFEEKTFTQYFMPYKAVGEVKNASIDAAVNLEQRDEGVYISAYATGKFEDAMVRVMMDGAVVSEQKTVLSPVDIYETVLPLHANKEEALAVEILAEGRILVSYQPEKPEIPKVPSPAGAAKAPEELMTNEELYLTGLHIEQYRHATYLPDPYYLEGLKRDAGDIRINNAYGCLLMRRGQFADAEHCFRKAAERATWKNPNPYDSEPYYNLGLALFYQGREDEAYDAFYKATWSAAQQETAFYYLAAIDARRGEYKRALELAEKGLVKNIHNVKARGLKGYLLRKCGMDEKAITWDKESLDIDHFDYVSMAELARVAVACNDGSEDGSDGAAPGRSSSESSHDLWAQMHRLMRGFAENYLQAARDYAEFGAYEEAVGLLASCTADGENPMPYYYAAYYMGQMGQDGSGMLAKAEAACPDYCFPNKLEDILVLEAAIRKNSIGAKAYYYLGNLYYDKLQPEKATRLWETSAELEDRFAIVWRNLSLSYYNKFQQYDKARAAMERAYELEPGNARIFLELDQLYKKTGMNAEARLARYEAHRDVIADRDDLYIEYITLYNQLGRYEEAYSLITGRRFHPWEGGEGKITTQYTVSLLEMARAAIKAGNDELAKDYLERALVYPENLGEGKLEGTKDNHIYYHLGCVLEHLGDGEGANRCFALASAGTEEPAGMMYYYDQPADMILYQGLSCQKLGKPVEGKVRFHKLVDYGECHMYDHMRIEYFAVSLPDFLIFEENLDDKNRAHCHYLIGLGCLGLGDTNRAEESFEEALRLEPNHLNASRYREYVRGGRLKSLFL